MNFYENLLKSKNLKKSKITKMKSIYLIIFGLLLLWTNPASASKTCKCVCEDQNRITNLIDITISEEYTLSEEVHNSITIQPEPQPESQPAPQPAPQPESDFDECQRLFQYEAVTAHNNYRKMHHVSPLNSNTELQKIAFNYANYLASNDVFQHSKATGLGENLAFVWSSQVKTLNDCSGIKSYINFFMPNLLV